MRQSADAAPSILHADSLSLTFEPQAWPFAEERRAEIDAFFTDMQKKQPALWNGRVLLMHRFALDQGVMRGAFLETDYASFAAWQRWGCPPAEVYDCFGAAAIQSADGAFLVGVMGAHTLNAGHLYFPCGTPDPKDIAGGKVDFDFSLQRELTEETGLDAAEFTPDAGYIIAIDGTLICAIKVMRSGLDAKELRARILDNLAREKQPELADVRIVRSASDFDPMMRKFVKAFLADRFAKG